MFIEVTKRDGTSETVTLAPLPDKFGAAFDYIGLETNDEPRFVEAICDRPEGWADSLTLESVERIIAAADEMNRNDPAYPHALQGVRELVSIETFLSLQR